MNTKSFRIRLERKRGTKDQIEETLAESVASAESIANEILCSEKAQGIDIQGVGVNS